MPFDLPRTRHLPLILQNELAECGLASLAMVASYHGHKIDLNGLRQQFALSMKGATLEHMITIADALDLGARPLRAELEHIPELRTPCILHWELNHYVVLKAVNGNKVHIHDPARGARILSMNEVSKAFTGVVLELEPVAGFRKKDITIQVGLSDLWNKLTGWKRSLLQTLTLSIVLQLFVLVSPIYLQLVVDEALPRFDNDLLVFLAVVFGLVVVLQGVTEGLRSWIILNLGQLMTYQMIANLFHHLMRLPTSFFEKRFISDILSRMRSTVPIQEALTKGVVAAIIDGVTALITGAIIFVYSPLLGAIVLATVFLYIFIATLLFPRRRMFEEEELVARAEEQSHLIESIMASTTIKLFGRENEREAVWRNYFGKVINAGIAVGRYEIGLKTAQTILMGLQLILVVYFGATMIMDNQGFTVGALLAVLLYRANFIERAIALVEQGIEFRLLGLHLERLADIVTSPQEQESASRQMAGKTLQGQIRLDCVSFQYSQHDPLIFQDLSLEIDPGEFVAIVGPSGGGKTTLSKLMLGLYEPTKGSIHIDQVPMRAFGTRLFRSQVGVVQQDDQLFAGTIADNISIFATQTDMDRVVQCGKTAKIHDDIMAMPMNYLSLVGSMGSSLSGGQKQRVLFARALYRDPRILFLDEGTANLDIESEAEIADAIENMSITRVIIAHRPELVRRADKVFEMREGKLSQLR